MINLLRIELRDETDIVNCRQRARQIADLLTFESLQQTQIATAVSEIARNALRYAGSGRVQFSLHNELPLRLVVTIEDKGPGIADINAAIASPDGMGLKGSRRLMDVCDIRSTLSVGTTVILGKILPRAKPLTSPEITQLVDALLRMRSADAMSEVRLQNTELLLSLEELKKQQDVAIGYQNQLEELNKELADTNRGVIALNIELEDQARTVKEVSEVKARFLSHVTHEFRTPVNSILSMSRILLTSGASLDTDQRKQVTFIRQAAEGLSEMVNDLLDTVKADAGRMTAIMAPVNLSEILDTLRATFRPLLPTDRKIDLIIEDNENIPLFISDETKLSQILRNFISNSLKFTEHGEIRLTAVLTSQKQLEIVVRDTGIGIAPEHQGMIFEEFMQVQGAHQKRAKGTGLGLPLARKLAGLLDGDVSVESTFGIGSAFTLRLPFHAVDEIPDQNFPRRILVIDDEEAIHYNIRDVLGDIDCDFAFALNGRDGLALVGTFHPDLILLDVRMPVMDGFEVLKYLKDNPATAAIPVLLNSSMRFSMEDFPDARLRPTGILLKDNEGRETMLNQIRNALRLEGRDTHI